MAMQTTEQWVQMAAKVQEDSKGTPFWEELVIQ
jgi:hypothetical protein